MRTTQTPGPRPRPRRSDAERNHRRIVAAARVVLAESGAGARVEDIAHAAGLGVGTLYRHFPDKDALIDAVLDDAFGEIVGLAEAALDEADAWEAFAGFLRRTVALHAANSGLRGIAAGSERGRERAAAMRDGLRPLIAGIVERAQAEGGLRPDFAPEDVPLVFWGAGKVIDLSAPVAPEIWQRFLAFVLDGLRAAAASPLPTPPLTRGQLDRVTARRVS
jgi:AcrR family transcriptional regulator